MTKFKTLLLAGAVISALGATSLTAYAATSYKTPAEIVAEITNRTVDSVTDEKVETGKTYGTIASEAGKLDEFKAASLEAKKAYFDAKVAEGTMTQEEADAIIQSIEANQATCDGTGTERIGQNSGVGFGSNGQGSHSGSGSRGGNRGGGNGRGMQLHDGSCYTVAE